MTPWRSSWTRGATRMFRRPSSTSRTAIEATRATDVRTIWIGEKKNSTGGGGGGDDDGVMMVIRWWGRTWRDDEGGDYYRITWCRMRSCNQPRRLTVQYPPPHLYVGGDLGVGLGHGRQRLVG
jgi:hypothetical protein